MGIRREQYEQGWRHMLAGNLDGLLAMMSPDVEVKEAGQTFRGRDQVRKQYQTWLDAFTDLQVEFLDVVESGDALAGEVRISMTHTGPLVTPNGTIPPTGKRVILESVDIAHARDGLIVSFHSYFDQLGLMAQLGLMEAPAPA